MNTPQTAVPDWFKTYTTLPRNDHWINVADASGIDAAIHFQTWNEDKDKPGLLFVHGHAAHSHWWDFIAPAFMTNYRVAAMDMSGSGDSAHRSQYSARGFAEEIYRVALALGENTIVVGHSLGGTMTRICAHLYGSQLGSIVIVDSNISSSRGNRTPPPMPKKKDRIYPSLGSGMKRFRLRPAQPAPPAYISQYIAAHSLKETEGGFSFKLDPAVFAKMKEVAAEDFPDAVTMVKELKCPAGFIYGEQSIFFPAANVEVLKSIFPAHLLAGIQNAHHHLFLEQPRIFCEVLATMLKAITDSRV